MYQGVVVPGVLRCVSLDPAQGGVRVTPHQPPPQHLAIAPSKLDHITAIEASLDPLDSYGEQ